MGRVRGGASTAVRRALAWSRSTDSDGALRPERCKSGPRGASVTYSFDHGRLRRPRGGWADGMEPRSIGVGQGEGADAGANGKWPGGRQAARRGFVRLPASMVPARFAFERIAQLARGDAGVKAGQCSSRVHVERILRAGLEAPAAEARSDRPCSTLCD